MKRVKPITVRLTQVRDSDSSDNARSAFALLFKLARKELKNQRKSEDAGTPNQSYHPDATQVDNS